VAYSGGAVAQHGRPDS